MCGGELAFSGGLYGLVVGVELVMDSVLEKHLLNMPAMEYLRSLGGKAK
jgi:hypothetical protein